MKRVTVVVVSAVLFVFLFAAGSGASVNSSERFFFDEESSFVLAARIALRPASGKELYNNLHEYMWRNVYMMGLVDRYEDGIDRQVYIQSLNPRGTKVFGDFHGYNRYEGRALNLGGRPHVADVLLVLPPGVEPPSAEIEFVGVVCGAHRFYSTEGRFVRGIPIVCITDQTGSLIRVHRVATLGGY